MDTRKRAVIYIASGKQYIEEAFVSARSIGDQQFDRIICTPDMMSPLQDALELPPRQSDYWYLDYVNYLNIAFNLLPYDQFLLLDTDTYICGDLTDFFTVLNRFDIAGTHAIARETQVQRDDIPASFPELHVGAISFNRNAHVAELFSLWLEIFRERLEFFKDNDQGPLREALWKLKHIKLGILPSEFCFRYRWGGLVNGQVRVLHGREHGTSYEKIAREVNGRGIRVYNRRELA